MLRLARIFALTAIFVGLFAALTTGAQTYTIPQSAFGIVMNQVTAPTTTPIGAGAVQCSPPVSAGNTCQIPNYGQNVHLLTYATNNEATYLDIRLEGSLDGVNFFAISADATSIVSGGTPQVGSVCALGTYAAIRANLVSLTGLGSYVTASYVGTSAVSPACPLVPYNPAQSVTSLLFHGASTTSAALTQIVNTPYANSYGTLFYSNLSGASSARILVEAQDAFGNDTPIESIPVNGSNLVLTVPLPEIPASQILVSLTGGSAPSTQLSVNAYIIFGQPPIVSPYSSQNITSATSVGPKIGAGLLHSVVVNTGSAASTVTLYDGVNSSGCTGTKLGTLSSANPIVFNYDLLFSTGLCVTTSGTADIIVTWR